MRRAGWCAALALVLAACEQSLTPLPVSEGTLDQQLRAQLGTWSVVPIGAVPLQDSNLVKLGRALMFDPILSGNRDVACASCHQPAAHLTDGRSLPSGTKGRLVPRSAPTLLNGGLGLYQLFWDGRLQGGGGGGPCCGGPNTTFVLAPNTFITAPNILAAQAGLPVLNRHEMRGDSGDVDRFGNPNELAVWGDGYPQTVYNLIMQRLLAIPEYVAMFDAAFPAGAHEFPQAAAAMAAFQISALTGTNSPFDRYLNRDDAALTSDEKQGALLFFTRARCSQCHSGPLLGGQQIANVGVPQIGVGLDSGRGALGDFAGGPGQVNFYRFAFRVPPLRNVELTAPYFHDGAYPTLDAVVRHYNDVHAALGGYDPLNVAPEFRAMIHADAATIALVEQTLDSRIAAPIGLTDQEQRQVVAFLKSLTDPAARTLAALRPASVPSGLPVP